jgi:hypothetical protein
VHLLAKSFEIIKMHGKTTIKINVAFVSLRAHESRNQASSQSISQSLTHSLTQSINQSINQYA